MVNTNSCLVIPHSTEQKRGSLQGFPSVIV
jgi:hypothetical protein